MRYVAKPRCWRWKCWSGRAEPKPPRGSKFVEPELTVEAEFTDFTAEGVMRHPTYKGNGQVEVQGPREG